MGLRRAIAVVAAACGLMLAAGAQAAGLPDPTRPPAGAASHSSGEQTAQPVLQSVMISPARRAAIISGQTVALGQSYGGARLVKITETEVVLKNGSELQTLKLFPDLEKEPASGRGKTSATRQFSNK